MIAYEKCNQNLLEYVFKCIPYVIPIDGLKDWYLICIN